LCVPVCPVDCIALETASGPATGWAAWSETQAAHAQARYRARQSRLAQEREANHPPELATAERAKQTVIEAALARARAQRAP